ncbi:13500_t:CDS:2, partial [Funneliformis geosporum]
MVEYVLVCFDYCCLDAKQNTLKVFMNTFYGTAGDSKSPFFLRELAGGVTSARQRNIKLVVDFVKRKGFGISNRISKEEYWSRMVEISMVEMEKLRIEVNVFLKEDNGSSYLKMAYEKVLFPVLFAGKKKYYGIPHESKPNFNKKLFIWGVETVKWEQSKDMLKETIRDISQINLNRVVKTIVWRPDKNNKSLRIIHQKEWEDKMEYPEVARQLSKKINISYYLNSVVSLYTRFINYDELFQPPSEIVLGVLKKLKDGNKA